MLTSNNIDLNNIDNLDNSTNSSSTSSIKMKTIVKQMKSKWSAAEMATTTSSNSTLQGSGNGEYISSSNRRERTDSTEILSRRGSGNGECSRRGSGNGESPTEDSTSTANI